MNWLEKMRKILDAHEESWNYNGMARGEEVAWPDIATEICAVIEAAIKDEDDIDHPLSPEMTRAIAALQRKVEQS